MKPLRICGMNTKISCWLMSQSIQVFKINNKMAAKSAIDNTERLHSISQARSKFFCGLFRIHKFSIAEATYEVLYNPDVCPVELWYLMTGGSAEWKGIKHMRG